jgi:hypothetical protein
MGKCYFVVFKKGSVYNSPVLLKKLAYLHMVHKSRVGRAGRLRLGERREGPEDQPDPRPVRWV